jgi:hypothetical protein
LVRLFLAAELDNRIHLDLAQNHLPFIR